MAFASELYGLACKKASFALVSYFHSPRSVLVSASASQFSTTKPVASTLASAFYLQRDFIFGFEAVPTPCIVPNLDGSVHDTDAPYYFAEQEKPASHNDPKPRCWRHPKQLSASAPMTSLRHNGQMTHPYQKSLVFSIDQS